MVIHDTDPDGYLSNQNYLNPELYDDLEEAGNYFWLREQYIQGQRDLRNSTAFNRNMRAGNWRPIRREAPDHYGSGSAENGLMFKVAGAIVMIILIISLLFKKRKKK